ncbi:hypothetical protein AV530_018860 [Patagioenas fasciata monilis]|uniref:Uncharacterized protein n=1 Tax=Patagioenas fasciata monilis TaxID=372326 RepID=A0A1V4JJS0_PATFA|nr:hypothetical protein AV530_018860 [Patagioenas fasciata monilis]
MGPSPMAFEPVAQHVFAILGVAQLSYHHCNFSTFLELRNRNRNPEFHAQRGQEQQRRRKMGSKLDGHLKTALAEAGEEPAPSQQAAALLADQVSCSLKREQR